MVSPKAQLVKVILALGFPMVYVLRVTPAQIAIKVSPWYPQLVRLGLF